MQLGPDSGIGSNLGPISSDTALPSISHHLLSPLPHHQQLLNRTIRPISSPIDGIPLVKLQQQSLGQNLQAPIGTPSAVPFLKKHLQVFAATPAPLAQPVAQPINQPPPPPPPPATQQQPLPPPPPPATATSQILVHLHLRHNNKWGQVLRVFLRYHRNLKGSLLAILHHLPHQLRSVQLVYPIQSFMFY